jgi:hypothetical protein
MNMPAITRKTLHQDAVKATVDNWPRSKQLITYKQPLSKKSKPVD